MDFEDDAVFPYEAETWGVMVRVFPEFVDDESSPEHNEYLWRYTVQIENNVDHTIQLVNRHWEITDARGRRHTLCLRPLSSADGFHPL